MSSSEFSLWWSEYRVNPWGDGRRDAYDASIVQAIGNYAGKMRKEPAKLADCFIEFDPEAPEPPEVDPATFFAQFKH